MVETNKYPPSGNDVDVLARHLYLSVGVYRGNVRAHKIGFGVMGPPPPPSPWARVWDGDMSKELECESCAEAVLETDPIV